MHGRANERLFISIEKEEEAKKNETMAENEHTKECEADLCCEHVAESDRKTD